MSAPLLDIVMLVILTTATIISGMTK